MKKHRKIFRKNSMVIFQKIPEYEIFRTNFLPHITTIELDNIDRSKIQQAACD